MFLYPHTITKAKPSFVKGRANYKGSIKHNPKPRITRNVCFILLIRTFLGAYGQFSCINVEAAWPAGYGDDLQKGGPE